MRKTRNACSQRTAMSLLHARTVTRLTPWAHKPGTPKKTKGAHRTRFNLDRTPPQSIPDRSESAIGGRRDLLIRPLNNRHLYPKLSKLGQIWVNSPPFSVFCD